MERIYLINIDDVNKHIDKNMENPEEVNTIEYAESLTEEQCREICDKSTDKWSGCYTFKEFEGEFNNDIDNVFTSDSYFIRFFLSANLDELLQKSIIFVL